MSSNTLTPSSTRRAPGRREAARASPRDPSSGAQSHPERNRVITLDFDHLAVEDVSRHFGRRRALSRISFHAQRGAILGLLGPNGAGKSTMLAMLATLLRPTSGVIRYGAVDPAAHGPSLRARIGVLGHDLFLYPEL